MTMKCPTPYKLAGTPQEPGILVPCGACGACRANRRVEWSFRLKEELKNSINAKFVTLTYDEKSLPHSDYTDTGTLVKTDLQKFIKRLRKHQSKITSQKIRYYAVGEYGTTTARPHYHILLFNIDNRTSSNIENIWGMGHTTISPVNDARLHYTTKYHVNFDKKSCILYKYIDENDKKVTVYWKNPEFALMSTRPGIGHQYVARTGKWHTDNENLYVINNGYKQNLPRYLKNKIFTEDQLKPIQEKQTTEHQEKHWEKLEKLEKQGFQLPERELKHRRTHAAERVKKKGGDNDQL